MNPLLTAGIHSQDVGSVLAAVLAGSSRPLTSVLEDLSGRRLHLKVLDDGQRPLTEAERFRLAADGVACCRWRTGLLHAAGDEDGIAASTVLLWLPARLPWGVCQALNAGTTPAGKLLAPLGMRRQDRRAMATAGMEDVTGADAAVRSTAVLAIGGTPVAIADETITRRFAESLASQRRSAGTAVAGTPVPAQDRR